MRALGILFCTFVMMVLANSETPCVAPKQWEGKTYTYDHHRDVFSRGHITYDGKGERMRFVEDVEINGTSDAYEHILLFQKHMQYRIELKSKKCEKSNLNYTFVPIEVHPNSTLIGDSIIGSLSGPGMGVIVREWGHQFTGGFAFQTFTLHGCYPVQFQMFNETSHYKVDHSFTDLTLGIRDASVFEPPKECM